MHRTVVRRCDVKKANVLGLCALEQSLYFQSELFLSHANEYLAVCKGFIASLGSPSTRVTAEHHSRLSPFWISILIGLNHRLRTPNEGTNQKYLKIWACVADKMLRVYLEIWDWDWIFSRAVKAISSLGVRSPWVERQGIRLGHLGTSTVNRVIGVLTFMKNLSWKHHNHKIP